MVSLLLPRSLPRLAKLTLVSLLLAVICIYNKYVAPGILLVIQLIRLLKKALL